MTHSLEVEGRTREPDLFTSISHLQLPLDSQKHQGLLS